MDEKENLNETEAEQTESFEKIEENQTESNENVSSAKEKHSFVNDIFDMVDAVVVAVVAAIFMLTFIFRTGFVSGPSMEKTMFNNDRYLVSGLFYTPEQGDIVVFQPGTEYDSENKLWVKRIIAVAGQTVDIDEATNRVMVDGAYLNESYLTGNITYKRASANVDYPYTVPEGYVFVMGDNRQNSTDSRIIGAVDTRRILGRVIFRFYPFDSIGAVD